VKRNRNGCLFRSTLRASWIIVKMLTIPNVILFKGCSSRTRHRSTVRRLVGTQSSDICISCHLINFKRSGCPLCIMARHAICPISLWAFSIFSRCIFPTRDESSADQGNRQSPCSIYRGFTNQTPDVGLVEPICESVVAQEPKPFSYCILFFLN
jgi:hypothetical protein